jgi:hypothetical protein
LRLARLVGVGALVAGVVTLFGSDSGAFASIPTTLYAAPSAQGTGDCLTLANACGLSTALADAGAGTTVLLVTAGNEGVVTSWYSGGFSISTAGTSAVSPVTIEPAPGVNNPILDGGGSHQVLHVGSSMYLHLDGLTIQNGSATYGAGINNIVGGTVTVSHSTFLDNIASGDGGAIDNGDLTFLGTLTVSNSTFSGNTASDNGGAIDNGDNTGTGTLTISNSTFSGNTASHGGAIDNGDNNGTDLGSGVLTVTNSTFSGNAAGDGGDIDSGDNGFLPVSSVTVAANVFAENCGIFDSAWVDHGYNVGSDSSCFNGGSADNDSGGSNLSSLLGPLADNGGPTQTMALFVDNPAFGLVPNPTAGLCPVVADQRGMPSPSGQACDAGSVQLGVVPSSAYVAVTPYRICDTRGTNGLSGTDAQCAGHTLSAGGSLTIQVAGTNPSGASSGGLPASGVAAVVLNVTATKEAAQGFLTVWPSEAPRPNASSLNYRANKTVPNLVTVAVSGTGMASLYSLQGTDVVVDVEGYYSAPSGTVGLFNSVTPYRVCDTRGANGLSGTDAQCAGHTLPGGVNLNIQVTGTNPSGTGSGGVPATGVSAVVLNVTAVGHGTGYVTVFPTGGSAPTASNLNFSAGQVVPNRVIVPVSASGQVSLTSNSSVDLIVDVNGWFTDGASPSQTGALFVAATPSRICDTRSNGNATPCAGHTVSAGGSPLVVAVAGQGPVPASGVVAVVSNLTVTDTTAQSYLTAWPTGQSQPTASDLNWVAGLTVPNMAVVGLGVDGQISAFVKSGSADVLVDVTGWYVNAS